MKTLSAALPKQLRVDLAKIRRGVATFAGRRQGVADGEVFAPLEWADQAISALEAWLLDEEQKQLLGMNPWDVFLLHACAFLCDVGPEEAADMPGGPSGITLDSAQRRQFILDHWQALGIQDASLAEIIADLCAQVGCDDASPAVAWLDDEHTIDGVAVNGTLISAAVRLAKALNPKDPVTAARVTAFLPPSIRRTYRQYESAFSVTGTGAHPYVSGTIQMKIQCRDPEIHRALKHHERTVQKRLQNINRYASPRFLFSDVIYEIEAQGYTPVDLKFCVDTSAALHLLTGNRLYADNRVFLRELIQNAVDACNLRKRLETGYEPAISIRFNEDISKVTVRDNGIGMDRQWIEKYFLTIGISLYQSSEVRSAKQRSRIDFSFISQFGIGFLSSFLVADKIVIKTRKPDNPGLMITITNLRDYFDVRPMDDEFDTGTEVTLHLKPSRINYCRSLEYIGYLRSNIRFLNVPVDFQDQDGRHITLGREQLSYANAKTAHVDFIAPLAFKSSEGYVLMRALKNVDRIFAVETARGGVSVFQDGIFITQLDSLLPQGARQHAVGRINLRGEDKCALSMDRNRIFWTDGQLRDIKKAIRMGLADAASRFIAAVDSQDVAPHDRQSIINNLAICFDFNEVDDAIYTRLCDPLRKVVEKRFRDFLRIHFAHTLRAEGMPEADGYSQGWQQRIVDSFRKN